MDAQTPEELRSNLEEYRAQKQQVEELLQLDASNEEYIELSKSLAEVIELTEDLLREAAAPTGGSADAAVQSASAGFSREGASAAPVVVESAAPAVSPMLPPQVAQQIRAAQQKAALSGQAPAAWAIGARVQAVWSGDGEWYAASIIGVSAAGNFVVSFDEDGGTEEVDRSAVRAAAEDDASYRGVSAPARVRVSEEPVVTEMPKWLVIQPEDDEKTKAKKKKLMKSYKSKMRFAKLDQQTKDKQQSWQNFQKGKVSKKKPKGFMTGHKKSSMFSVPEGGKVGVIGSGKPMTEYKHTGRHDFKHGGDGAGE